MGSSVGGDSTKSDGAFGGVEVRRQQVDLREAALCAGEQAGEVGHGAADAVEADRQQGFGVAAVETLERGREAGAVEVLAGHSFVGDELEVPAAALGLGDQGGALCV